jgi:hypothetical protein
MSRGKGLSWLGRGPNVRAGHLEAVTHGGLLVAVDNLKYAAESGCYGSP